MSTEDPTLQQYLMGISLTTDQITADRRMTRIYGAYLVKKYLISRKDGFQQDQSNDYSLEAQRTLSIDNVC
jgi:hypothetical protein